MTGGGAIYPRPLSEREAEILRFMLSPTDARLEPFRQQIASVMVTGICGCGCATIHLGAARELGEQDASRVRDETETRLLTETQTRGAVDLKTQQLLLFMSFGRLSALELVWYDRPRPEFPPAEALDPPKVVARLGVRPRIAGHSLRDLLHRHRSGG
jgi:hypothetical protein